MDRDLHSRRGQGVVELALLMPFLLWLCMGIVDFGRVYYYDNVAINAARSGARVAAISWKSDNEARQATINDADNRLQSLVVTVSPASTETSGPFRTPGDPIAVMVQYKVKLITPLISSLVGDAGGNVSGQRTASMVVVY